MNSQVKRYAERLNGSTKSHTEPAFGHIVRMFDDYGFIETSLGSEYYFHASNVIDSSFGELDIGTTVTFFDSGMVGDTLQASHISKKAA